MIFEGNVHLTVIAEYCLVASNSIIGLMALIDIDMQKNGLLSSVCDVAYTTEINTK